MKSVVSGLLVGTTCKKCVLNPQYEIVKEVLRMLKTTHRQGLTTLSSVVLQAFSWMFC